MGIVTTSGCSSGTFPPSPQTEAVIPAALKSAASLAGVVLCLGSLSARAAIPTVEECLRQLEADPRSFEPYRCLTNYGDAARRTRVLAILEKLKRRRPDDGRPVFYSALTRALAGEAVEEGEFEQAREKFEAEGNVHGQVFALVVMGIAASEVVIGLGIVVAVARRKADLDVDRLASLRN